jgi:hypothetical protein
MKCLGFAIVAIVLASPLELKAAQIYLDNFVGDVAADLHGTAPDVGVGAWTAHTGYDANGAITPSGTPGGRGAWLPLTPVAGQIYTLSASFRGVTGNANWFGLGFGKAVPANVQGADNRFTAGDSVGRAWMIVRGDNSASPNQAFIGSATNGTTGTFGWSGGPADGGAVDLKVVLDTTGGSGAYAATFFAKRPGDPFVQVSTGALDLDAEDIGSVGFAWSASTGIAGSIDEFSLTTVPEPSSMALTGLGFAAAGAFVRRRPRR